MSRSKGRPKTLEKISKERVKTLCKELGITQKKMIDDLDIPPDTYKRCMHDEEMNPRTIQRIAGYLETSKAYLQNRTDKRNPEEGFGTDTEYDAFIGMIKTMIDEGHPIFPKGYLVSLHEMETLIKETGNDSFKNSPAYHVIKVILNSLTRDSEHIWFEKARLKKAIETNDETLIERIKKDFQENH